MGSIAVQIRNLRLTGVTQLRDIAHDCLSPDLTWFVRLITRLLSEHSFQQLLPAISLGSINLTFSGLI